MKTCKTRYYELTPNGIQKSFYGKAIVQIDSNGDETLYSYNTPIIKRLKDGSLIKLWGGWSATTGKHIKAFCGLNKAGFMALEYEPTPKDEADAYQGTLYYLRKVMIMFSLVWKFMTCNLQELSKNL